MKIPDINEKKKQELTTFGSKLKLQKRCVDWMNQELVLQSRLGDKRVKVTPWSVYFLLYKSASSYERKLMLLRMESNHFLNLGYLNIKDRTLILNDIWKRNANNIKKHMVEKYTTRAFLDMKYPNEKLGAWLINNNYAHALYTKIEKKNIKSITEVDVDKWWMVSSIPETTITGYTSSSLRTKINTSNIDSINDLAIEAD